MPTCLSDSEGTRTRVVSQTSLRGRRSLALFRVEVTLLASSRTAPVRLVHQLNWRARQIAPQFGQASGPVCLLLGRQVLEHG